MGNAYEGEVSDWPSCCGMPGSTPPDVANYVVSLNSLNGILTLVGGAGVEIDIVGGTFTFSVNPAEFIALPFTGENFRIKADGTLQYENATTGLYHTAGADGPDGAAYMTLNDTGEA